MLKKRNNKAIGDTQTYLRDFAPPARDSGLYITSIVDRSCKF